MTVLNLSYLMGLCFLTGKTEDQHSFRMLWDIAFSQSLILSRVLPLGAASTCDASAGVRGIKICLPPLHNVHIQLRLITGFFLLAVLSCFPIEGVDFIKGNDIDGGNIYPVTELVDSPILSGSKTSRCFSCLCFDSGSGPQTGRGH